MFTRTTVFLFLLVSLAFTSSVFAELNMQDGKWEITTNVEMKGMPPMPPTKFTQCITRKDAIPQKPENNQDCKVTNNKVSGDTVTWSMQCKSKEGTMDSNGKITYKNDTFDGIVNMNMDGPKTGKMQMTQHMSGKRIGNCK
jgi:hypothetical protein